MTGNDPQNQRGVVLTCQLNDRLLWFWAILWYWHYTTAIYFTSKCTHMYHMLIKRQIIGLSNDIDNIKMGKRILLKIN